MMSRSCTPKHPLLTITCSGMQHSCTWRERERGREMVKHLKSYQGFTFPKVTPCCDKLHCSSSNCLSTWTLLGSEEFISTQFQNNPSHWPDHLCQSAIKVTAQMQLKRQCQDSMGAQKISESGWGNAMSDCVAWSACCCSCCTWCCICVTST